MLFLESVVGFEWWMMGWLISYFVMSYTFPHLHLSVFKPIGTMIWEGKRVFTLFIKLFTLVRQDPCQLAGHGILEVVPKKGTSLLHSLQPQRCRYGTHVNITNMFSVEIWQYSFSVPKGNCYCLCCQQNVSTVQNVDSMSIPESTNGDILYLRNNTFGGKIATWTCWQDLLILN